MEYLGHLDILWEFSCIDEAEPDLPWAGVVFGMFISNVWYWCTDQASVYTFHDRFPKAVQNLCECSSCFMLTATSSATFVRARSSLLPDPPRRALS